MKQILRWVILVPFLAQASAQAADLRLGLHAEAFGTVAENTNGEPKSPVTIWGLEASATQPLGRYVAVRGKLGLDLFTSSGASEPAARVDVTLLSRGNFYIGAGLGTGIFFSDPGAGAFFLTNAHALVGKNFGPAQLEGYVRAGLGFGAGISLSTLVR